MDLANNSLPSDFASSSVARCVQITAKSQIVLKHAAPPVESFISVTSCKRNSQLCCVNIEAAVLAMLPANVAKQSRVVQHRAKNPSSQALISREFLSAKSLKNCK